MKIISKFSYYCLLIIALKTLAIMTNKNMYPNILILEKSNKNLKLWIIFINLSFLIPHLFLSLMNLCNSWNNNRKF